MKKSLSILYVEDEHNIRSVVERILLGIADTVYSAKDGKEALEFFYKHTPDLIITDITMPKMNGFDFAKAVRQENKHIPIIAVTAHNDIHDFVNAIEIGFSSFLLKPLDIDKLIEAIDNASRIVFLEKEKLRQAFLLEQYKNIVDVSGMLARLDSNGIIKYTNEQFCTIMGYTESEVIGESYKMFKTDESSETSLEDVWVDVCAKNTWQGVLKIKDPYDLTLWLNATFMPILNDSNEIEEVLALFLNITDIKYKQYELEQEKRITTMILDTQNSITAFATNEFGMLRANKTLFDFTGFADLQDFHSKYSRLSDIFIDGNGCIGRQEAVNWNDISKRSENGEKLRVQIKDSFEKINIFDLQVRKAFIAEYDFLAGYDFFIITLNNITEFENAVKAAKEAERSKGEFLANMSHEIRTPMNGILGFASLLEKSKLDKEQADYVKIIAQSANHLLSIINEVLDFSKIESGKLEIEAIEFNPSDEIETTIELFSAKALEKNITISSFIDPKLPNLIGDPMRIKQVLYNLLSNAIKFTPENGTIKVSVMKIAKDADYCLARFSILDSGVGIPKDKISTIFSPFAQADSSISRKYGGTGLGLAICDKIIKLMGSQLEVTSELDIGSDFYFNIALPLSANPSIEIPKCEDKILLLDTKKMRNSLISEYMDSFKYSYIYADESSIADCNIIFFDCDHIDSFEKLAFNHKDKRFICLTNKFELKYNFESKVTVLQMPLSAVKVLGAMFDEKNTFMPKHLQQNKVVRFESKNALIAEDNMVNQKLISILLNTRGITVTTANDGVEAIRLYQKNRYDIIFMDIHMPNMDGLGALKELQKLWNAKIFEKTPIVSLTANALKGDKERFLEAGFDEYLAKPIDAKELDRILTLFLEAIPLQECESQRVTKKIEVDMNNLIDVDDLVSGLGLDMDTIKMLLDSFKEDVIEDMQSLESAIVARDFIGIKDAAHKLKGACGNLRIKSGAEISLELEQNAKKSNIDFDYQDSYEKLKYIVDIVDLQ